MTFRGLLLPLLLAGVSAFSGCVAYVGFVRHRDLPPVITPALSARAPDAQREAFFPDAEMMRVGAYYYPEAWPHEQWARDIADIKKLDMEFVHMGEFAWTFMEPTDGHFDFAWLDECVDLCKQNGLKVVLCTPSPAPPVWLAKAHPEVMMVDAQGRRMQHGTRQQACWNDPLYRAYVGRVVQQLGQRYGNNPNVWGWQLDNELSHYGKEPCYCENCQASFRTWLEKKYGNIGALNAAWGTAFWSQRYEKFSQIRIPNQEELVAQINPHQTLDSDRWFADSAADYLRFQTNILRESCGNKQWITTNFMHDFPVVNPSLNANDFDISTFTIYPAHGNANEGPLGFRLGSMATLSFANDFFRTLNGEHGIMELQPGQVNWGDVNPQPLPGAVHMWLMRAFAQGSKLVCTYRFRETLSGPELYHYGLVGSDGVTPTNGGLQYQQAAQEIAKMRELRKPDAKAPAAYAARQAAILYSFEDRWDDDNHKQNVAWNTYDHMLKQYRALKRLGAPVDVITEDKAFDPAKYPFMVVPAVQLVDDELVARWKAYAEAGGNLIITCRTGQKDRRGQLWEGPWAKPILDLIGARIAFYDTLPAPNVGKISVAGIPEQFTWSSWGEILVPNGENVPGNQGVLPPPGPITGASGKLDMTLSVLATYADQYYAGQPAAITRILGKGTITYIGVDSTDGGLEAALIQGVYERAKVATLNLPDGFAMDWRDGFWVATNFTEKTVALPVPDGTKLLFGTHDVPPAGVTVWQEP